MPQEWTDIDPQDGDQLTAAGIQPDTDEWEIAVSAAKAAYLTALGEEGGQSWRRWANYWISVGRAAEEGGQS
jgi:hypothetical protein